MALKMRDDRNGKNNKRRKEDHGKQPEGCQEVDQHYVNGDMNTSIINASEGPGAERQVQKRIEHNEVEKRRKDRIKEGILQISKLLPFMTVAEIKANGNVTERSTFAALEKAAEYIKHLKDQTDQFLQEKGTEVQAAEINRLKEELLEVRLEKDKYELQLKAAGLITDFSANWSYKKFDGLANLSGCVGGLDKDLGFPLTSTDGAELKSVDASHKKKGSKSRRKNTISAQLEEKNASQDQKTDGSESNLSGQEQNFMAGTNFGMMGFSQNATMNPQLLNAAMFGGSVPQGQGQFILPAMNIMNPGTINPASINAATLNPSAMNAGTLNQGALNPATLNPPLVQNIGLDRCNGMVPYMSPNTNLSADGFGLLQMAMRDAGIVASSLPSSVSQTSQSTSAVSTSAVTSVNKSTVSSKESTSGTSSPLHTLASVATETLSSSVSNAFTPSSVHQVVANSHPFNGTFNTNTTQAMNLNMPIMTPNGIMHTLNSNLGLQMMAQNPTMPFNLLQNGGLSGIPMMPQQQGQIIYLNEQGIPIISNVPVQGMDGQVQAQIAAMSQNSSLLRPGSVPVQGNLHNVQKDQKTVQDSVTGDAQMPNNVFQFPANAMQAPIQPHDISVHQPAHSNQINSNNADVIFQAQQQFNQQLLQASQMSGLMPGIAGQPVNINPQNVNVVGNLPKQENAPSNANAGDNLMLPVSQNGNMLTINQSASAPMQLPSALILPNGQIIPVVTQPQLMPGNQQTSVSVVNTGTNVSQQKTLESRSLNNDQITTPNNTQEKETALSTPNSPATTRQSGLLMTTNTVVTSPNRPISTNVAALSTTVVPTTVTGSIMSTQVQKQQQATHSKSVTLHQQLMNGMTAGMFPPNANNAQVMQAQSNHLTAENNSCFPGNNPMTMVQSNQLMSNGGAVVITLPTNGPGQPSTSVLLDPITMQILGTLPQQQQQQQLLPQLPQQNLQQPQVQQNTLPPPPVPTPDQISKSGNDSGKKPAKKGSHRALKPKPSSAKSRATKSPQLSAATLATTNDDKSEPKETSTSESPSTDLLAQATESIFSDISPSISNFYNPANEDNPLHIDTSAGDTEEDAVAASPKKDRLQNSQAVYNKQPSTTFDLTDPSTSPYHFIESPPTVKEVAKKSKSKKAAAPSSQKAGGSKKSSKKNSSSKKNQNKEKGLAETKDSEDKQKDNDILATKQKDAAPIDQLRDVVEMFKEQTSEKNNDSLKSSHIEPISSSTPYHSLFSNEDPSRDFSQPETSVDAIIPASINFTENEICDVLDQVEKLGNSFTEETPVPITPVPKKSKSRKNKNQTAAGDEEHSTKKKKKTSHDDLESLNTSLNMENILASMTGHMPSKPTKDSNSKKKSSEPLTSPIEEPALLLPSFSSDRVDKPVHSSHPQKPKTNSELSGLSVSTEPNGKNLSIDNLSSPLQVSTNSPLISPNVSEVVRSLDSAVKSPNFCPSLDISPLQRSSEQKTDNMTQQNNDNKFNEFPSFFMQDNTEASQISPVSQSLQCISNDVSVSLQGTLSQSSASTLTASTSCKLSTEQQQQQPSNTSNIVNSAILSNHPPNNSAENNSLDNPNSHSAQSLTASMNSQLTYSAESLFSPASQLNALPDIRGELASNSPQAVPPLMHPSSQVNTNPHNTSPELSRPRTSIYSAENFVQPSMNCESQSVSKQSYNRPQHDFSPSGSNRGNPMNITNESFNFSNIASNVPSNNRGRLNNSNTSSSLTATSANAFSFTLAGNPEASNNNFSSQIGHHQFPFYPLHPSVTSSQGGSTDPSPDASRKADQMEPVGFPPFQSNGRSPHFVSPQLNPAQSHNQLPHAQPFANFTSPPEPSGGNRGGDNLFHNQPQIAPPTTTDKGNHRPLSGNSNVRKPKDSSQNRGHQVPRSDQQDSQSINSMERSMFVSTGLPSFYTPNRQQMSGPSPLETPPLHHLPQSSSDSRMGANSYQSSMSTANHPFSPEFSSVRIEGSSVQVQSGNQSYTQHQHTNPALEVNKHSRSKSKQVSDHLSRRQGLIPLDSQMAPRGNSSRQQSQQHDHRSSQNPGAHTPTPNTHLEQQPTTTQQNRSQKTAKQSKSQQQGRSKKASKQSYNQDLDPSVPHPLFDTSQGIPPYFGIPNRSPPPSRSGQPDGPTYMPHFLGPSSRGLPNSVHKNPPELGGTFNQLFPQVRTQSGLGLNFQPGFGMNPVHGGHGSAAQMKGHPGAVSVTQPMSSFNLTNIFSENCAQSNGGLNISPIKFPHGNTIIPPQPGMEHNTLQHHHQPGMLYHNRTPGPPPVLHNAMSINSLIGHNHPGMGQINNTMGQTFHGYGHPSSFSMPHLNFAMHDHGH